MALLKSSKESILEKLQIDEASLTREVLFVKETNDLLKSISNLRKRYTKETVDFILEQANIRDRALNKFPAEIVDKLMYEKSAYEQASTWNVSEYRAKRISNEFKNIETIWDLGSGIGIDTIIFAKYNKVISVEKDGERIERAEYNCMALEVEKNVKHELNDIYKVLPKIKENDLVYIDPSRRDGDAKKMSIIEYLPSLEIVNEILEKTENVVVKISPAVDLKELEMFIFNAEYELEFISENSELKEAVLWFGLKNSVEKRATILPQGITIASTTKSADEDENNEDEIEENEIELEVSSDFSYIFEPDFAIIRAGLINALAVKLDLVKVDQEVAYLGGRRALNTDELQYMKNKTQFKVIKVCENKLEQAVQYLIDNGYNFIDIKKRGIDIDPDVIQRQVNKQIKSNLPLKNAVLFFTYVNNIKSIIITEKLIK